jgi:hypothetical protein
MSYVSPAPQQLDFFRKQPPIASLAPLRTLYRSYRLWFQLGAIGLALSGLCLALAVWFTCPVTTISSIGISLDFQGAQQGKYSHGLPFSPEDLLDQSLLENLYEKNQLQQWLDFNSFKNALSINQSGVALNELRREYESKLGNAKLSGLERQNLEAEFQSRLKTASSSLFTISWTEYGRHARQPPRAVQQKVLEDLPLLWAETAISQKRVLLFPTSFPSLVGWTSDGGSMVSDPADTVAFLSRRMKVVEKGLEEIERLPGARQAALLDGTSLIDLQVRLRAFDEQSLPALRERFFAGAASEQALKQLLTTLEGMQQEHEGQLSLASDRLKALTQTYQDYLAGMSADASTPIPAGANSGANQVSGETQGQDSFLSQLLDFARSTADQPYRQKWVDQISQSRLEVGRLDVLVNKDRENVAQARVSLAAKVLKKTKGLVSSAIQPPPPGEDRAVRTEDAGIGAKELNVLRKLSEDSKSLVAIISQNYIGQSPSLVSISQPFWVGEIRTIKATTIVIGAGTWLILGSVVFVLLVLAHSRVHANLRKP